jgi:hypothetical protein
MAHPFIPAPNTAQVELIYTYQGTTFENTFHVQKGAPFTNAQLVTLNSTFNTWDSVGATAWANYRTDGCFLQQIKSRALDTSSAPVAIYVLPAPRGGGWSGSGQYMPANVAFCLTLQTGLSGRSQRGRIYVGGIRGNMCQAYPNGSDAVVSWANSLVASVNALITQLTAAGFTLVVTSFYNNGAWRTTASNTPVLNAAYADVHLDSQRRRLLGRGRN